LIDFFSAFLFSPADRALFYEMFKTSLPPSAFLDGHLIGIYTILFRWKALSDNFFSRFPPAVHPIAATSYFYCCGSSLSHTFPPALKRPAASGKWPPAQRLEASSPLLTLMPPSVDQSHPPGQDLARPRRGKLRPRFARVDGILMRTRPRFLVSARLPSFQRSFFFVAENFRVRLMLV